MVALGPFSLKFSGSSVGRPTAAIGEGTQAAPMLQVHTGLLPRTPKVIQYLLVTNALMGLFLSSVRLMGGRKGGFLNHVAQEGPQIFID